MKSTLEKQLYVETQKRLIIKAIEELQFEELFQLEKSEEGFRLKSNEDVYYSFNGTFGAWGNIQIDFFSFKKFNNEKEIFNFTIGDFFIEFQKNCKMSDQTLAQYVEEANQTLFSDIKVYENLERFNFNKLNFQYVDQNLPGHPKLIMNKGRVGWGTEEIQKYAPEFFPAFQLRWVAVKKEKVEFGISHKIDYKKLVPDSVSSSVFKMIKQEDYFICPIHPWQWGRYIYNQYQYEITSGDIIDLGCVGDFYSPQASIRTLSNKDNPKQYDIKTSLSILNTSCVRGISSKFINVGCEISENVKCLIKEDYFLSTRIDVLEEVAAIKFPNKHFEFTKNASYRYHELFGCVWRESVASKLEDDEFAIPIAGLLIKNKVDSMVRVLIENSNLNAEMWIRKYCETVILPLYHLQIEHGLGLVAHGQNTILVFKNNCPSKLIIKDFHGDLRISEDSAHKNNPHFQALDVLPAEYLLHDLVTGHFITVLRYLSRLFKEEKILTEDEFYKYLGDVIATYSCGSNAINEKNNILKEKFEKILINRVRFKAGYSETNQRLRPMLGKDLTNPLIVKDRNV